MPGGEIFVVIFFVLTAVAATGAMISIVEVPVAFLSEQFRMPRKYALALTLVLLALAGAPAALSQGELADVKIAGKTFFDLYDYASSTSAAGRRNVLCIFVGGVGLRRTKRADEQRRSTTPPQSTCFIICKYVTPLLVLVVLLDGLNII